jgi:hypothetical protein
MTVLGRFRSLRGPDFDTSECPFLANNGLSGHAASTSAPPPRADIRWPMSAFHPIASALPPAPDVGGTPGECLMLTRKRHSANANGSPNRPPFHNALSEVGIRQLVFVCLAESRE